MEEESSYIAALIAKLYENSGVPPSFTFSDENSDDGFIKQEKDSESDDGTTKHDSKKRKILDEEEEFFKNSSAAIIAESTEKTLKQMNIDPNSKEGKMQRRKIRNRMSAQIHRDRKKAYIDYLEDKVSKRDEVISILQKMLKKSHVDNEELRANLAKFTDVRSGPLIGNSILSRKSIPNHIPMPSPAYSSTSTESSGQHQDETSTSQSSSSPDHQDYFSDVEVDGNDFDSKFFNTANLSWDAEQYEDLALDLDINQPLSEEDLMKLPLQRVGSFGSGSLSMFSLVLMMSFSFFTGLVSMSTIKGGASSVTMFDANSLASPKSFLQPWNSVHSHSPGGFHDAEYLYGLVPTVVETNKEEEEVEDEEELVTTLPVTGGRVLLSLPSSDKDSEEDSADDSSKRYVIKSPTTRLPSTYSQSSSASLASLWRQQNYDFIGNIYPSSRDRDYRDMEKNTTEVGKVRRYLRFRGAENETSSHLGAAASDNRKDQETDNSHSTDKSVTLYQKDSGVFRGDASTPSSSPSRSSHAPPSSPLASKVLLSEGRVLLNPLLADLRSTVHANKDHMDPSDRSPDYDTHRAIIPSIPNMFSSSSGGDKDEGTASKLLTMMIPASSIQWGFEWLDESSPDNSDLVMRHLLKNFNLTTSVRGQFNDDQSDDSDSQPYSSVDMSKLWLEIGCNVVDAKLVQSIL